MALSAKAWSESVSYGEVFYARATGDAPEMESSKAAARQLKGLVSADTKILDVGCGVGHYLRSLRKEYPVPFSYHGADITPEYITLGNKAFSDDSNTDFTVASIEDLPFDDKSFDVVMCCNMLLHLPYVVKPIQELWRVTKGTLLIRTQVGNSTFRIKQVPEPDVFEGMEDPLFEKNGEPKTCHYYNIYSERYIRWLFGTFSDVEDVSIELDKDFDPKAIGSDQWPEDKKPDNLTEMWNGWQVHRYILQPWSFIRVTRKS
jgi:ubiquinone/menaquinone biosynthesis C-methylase UbiE